MQYNLRKIQFVKTNKQKFDKQKFDKQKKRTKQQTKHINNIVIFLSKTIFAFFILFENEFVIFTSNEFAKFVRNEFAKIILNEHIM